MGQEAAHICRLTRFLLQVVFAIGADPSFEDHDLTCEACTARHVLLFNCYVDELLESPSEAPATVDVCQCLSLVGAGDALRKRPQPARSAYYAVLWATAFCAAQDERRSVASGKSISSFTYKYPETGKNLGCP
jgi:hypothetical protein